MGGGSTRSRKSDGVLHAEALREALHRGTPSLTLATACSECSPVPRPDNLEVQAAYLEQLIGCTPEAISILDDNYQITRINCEFTRLFGFSPEEALGRRIHCLIVPPDRHSETRWIGEALAKGQRTSLETKRQRKDGTIIDVALSAAAVVAGGKQVAFYLLYRDISEQKRAEERNSALYRIAEIASAAHDLQQFYATVHSIVGELMYARNFYVALYDPASQLLHFPYFVDEEDPAPAPARAGRGLTEYVLRTGEPLLCTPEVFDDLVERGEVELIGAPSVDWLGVPLKTGSHVFGAVVVQSYTEKVRFREKERDVLTFVSRQLASAIKHKRHEDALRRSEARYRSLVQSAVYGICRFSLCGRFLDVNPALVSMLGHDSADAVRALDAKEDVFIDPQEHSALMRELHRRGHIENVEVRWKCKDHRQITVRISGRIADSQEDPGQVLEMIAEDITERRGLEDQFRQAQKMEAVGRLAGGVAHDFNNLLTVISGYSEVLLEQSGEALLREKVEAIRHAAERAGALTRQLLAFSRKQVLELKVVNINTIVSDLERLLRPLIGEDVELKTKLAASLGRTRADAGQIEQVVMNLVVNAKDAMPHGGKLTIETSNVDVDGDLCRRFRYLQPGPYIALTVSDTGIGMDEEIQSRIFEPFFTTKEKGKGTGLGLSTAYGIVKQSGGHILVESELGRGTAFRIYLPRLCNSADPEALTRGQSRPSRGSETVLLVEDEGSVRKLVRETLQSQGYTVLEANHGDMALKIAANHPGPIHMLITDVVMPNMSGSEVARQLASIHPSTKVLYLSGYAEDAIIHQGVLQPGTAFLQKPFTLQKFSRKIREVLGNRS